MTVKTRPAVQRSDCGECGMNVAAPEYHPYWFCLLFKKGYDPREMAEDFRKALAYVEAR